jgi:peptidoglycan hydrolase-like protein with peptidoglycan-binding domain
MNRTSRITATTLAALLAAAPAAAFAQSSTTGAPGSGTSTSDPGMTTGAPTANQPTAAQPGGMTGDTGQGQQLSQSTLENVQQQLQQQGFYKNAKVDGRWGPQTRRAVQSFQQAKGMPATGQLDEQTLGALGVNNQGG